MTRTAEELAEMATDVSIDMDIEAAQEAGDDAEANRLHQIRGGIDPDNPYELAVSGVDGETLPEVVESDDDAQPEPSPDDIENGGASEFMESYAPWDSLSEQEQDEEFAGVFNRVDSAEAELRVSWTGADLEQNAKFAFGALVSNPHGAGVLRAMQAVGIADHPDFIRFLADQGRRLAVVSGDPSTISKQKGNDTMSETSTENIQTQIDALERQIEQFEGDPGRDSERNDLYQRQLALGRKLPGGSAPIVGSGGRDV